MLPNKLNKKIGQALHDYDMINDGDRILVAVSGGVDSLVTAWILQMWMAKAPIHYYLEAVYVDHGYWSSDSGGEAPAGLIGRQMERFAIPFSTVQGWQLKNHQQGSCFYCSRNRRSQLFDLARKKNCRKLALGHHKDDLLETFFLNALYCGNISTMLPRQDLFGGGLALIRILSYLDKNEIVTIAKAAGIESVKNYCPFSGDTKRETIRNLLHDIYHTVPGAKSSLFSALGNVKDGYML